MKSEITLLQKKEVQRFPAMYKQSNRGKLGLQTTSSYFNTRTQQALHRKIDHELDYVKRLKSELALVGFD